jgi:hypothetical protein
MSLRPVFNALLAPFGYKCVRTEGAAGDVYDADGLRTIHDHTFMQDPAFQAAYARGVQALAKDGQPPKDTYHWHWRIHVSLWVAAHAAKLPGDFVECGVNYGFLSSAIMQYLTWNRLGKTFYLLDTFAGLDEKHLTDAEKKADRMATNADLLKSGHYVKGVDRVRANFAEWERVHIIVGTVPETLAQIPPGPIAYLHLDMNCTAPEIAAAEYLWDRLSPGAPILMDDYAYFGYAEQHAALLAFATRKGVPIVSLPTGQGIMLKPPAK